MATNRITLQSVETRGRLMGFANMFHKENREWWRTHTWLVHSLIWLLLVNGILLAVLTTPTPEGVPVEQESGVLIFVTVGGLMTGIGIVIVMQGAILDEKKSGTAAWVLSKPLSRPAFILAKVAGNALAALVIMVVLQGVVAFIQLKAFDPNPPALLPFIAGLGLMALHLLFYLSLTLMLGTIFKERGAVLGIPIGLLFGAQMIMGLAPVLIQIMPWLIILPPMGGNSYSLAQQVMLGLPLPTVTPIIATVLWIVVFVGVAIWQFEREEF
jgi:ABC-2 type transport system permease protein